MRGSILKAAYVFLDKLSANLFRISFVGLALFIPFSIAGTNISAGFGIMGWLLALAASRGRMEALQKMRRDPIFLGSILLVATSLISTLMSDNIDRGLNDWKSYWLLAIYLLVGFHLSGANFRKILFWILFVSGSLSALVAIVQAAGGIKVLFLDIEDKLRPSSTLFTMTFAGIFYQLITVNFSMLLKEQKFNKTFIILLAGLVIQISAFLFNLTRGAWLALFFGLVTVVVLLRKGKAVLAGALFLLIIIIFTLVNPTLNSRLRSIAENIKFSQDRSIQTRKVLWDISLNMIAEHPFFGVGMGDFSLEAESRLDGRFVKSTSDAHNIYLHVLATRGFFGFFPFILFWVLLLKKLSALEKKSRAAGNIFNRHLIVGSIAATVVVLVGALTENNIDDCEVFIAFLFLIGLSRSTESDDENRAHH